MAMSSDELTFIRCVETAIDENVNSREIENLFSQYKQQKAISNELLSQFFEKALGLNKNEIAAYLLRQLHDDSESKYNVELIRLNNDRLVAEALERELKAEEARIRREQEQKDAIEAKNLSERLNAVSQADWAAINAAVAEDLPAEPAVAAPIAAGPAVQAAAPGAAGSIALSEGLRKKVEAALESTDEKLLNEIQQIIGQNEMAVKDILMIDCLSLDLIQDPIALYCPEAVAYEYFDRSSLELLRAHRNRDGQMQSPQFRKALSDNVIDSNTPSTNGANPAQDQAVGMIRTMRQALQKLAGAEHFRARVGL